MSRRPVIGVAMQTLPAKPGGELPTCWIMGQRYVEALRSVGALPWLIPLLPHDPDTLAGIFDRLDGVFLTGGVDVDPSRYGEDRHPKCGTTDPDRDAVEIKLLEHATAANKPVLAVCRGIQILNVARGGTLYQDVAEQVPAAMKHDYFPTPAQPSRSYLAHEITVRADSHLGELVGEPVVPVNSMHHQAIKDLAPGLRPTAFAPDGIIEAVEGEREKFLVAVQWHPEELLDTQTGMKRLFTAFAAAAA
ncbi:MAG: gamma-glutamyl-gamma-aminobutyrate hydrolase family protein [Gemmataceae bacterium]